MSDDRIAGKEGSQGLASLRLWPFSLSHFHLCKQGKAKAAKALVFSTQVHSLAHAHSPSLAPSTAPCPAPRPRPSCSCRSSPFPLPVRLPGWVSWQAGKLGCLRQVNIPTTIDETTTRRRRRRGGGGSPRRQERASSERPSARAEKDGDGPDGELPPPSPCRRISSCPAQQ